MKIKDVLVFKDANHVDWTATEDEIRNFVMTTYPQMRTSEWAMTAENIIRGIRNEVKRIGVGKLYKQIMGK